MELFSLFVVIGVIVATLIITPRVYRREICKKVKSLGGKIIEIEFQPFDRGPYKERIGRRGGTRYKFSYWLDDTRKEGWVDFGEGSSGWRL